MRVDPELLEDLDTARAEEKGIRHQKEKLPSASPLRVRCGFRAPSRPV